MGFSTRRMSSPVFIQIAGRMEGNCKALIGRRNRLFPGFHGTTEQMAQQQPKKR